MMSNSSKEARMILAVKASYENPKLSCRAVARSFRVPESTLRSRVNGHLPLSECRPANTKMTDLEEQIILERILDLDSQGFAPQIASVEDMANFILKSQGKERVGQHWARRFIQRHLEIHTRPNRVYDF
jgi:transposase